MAYSVRKVDVWVGDIPDRPGGLAGKLEALSKASAALEFVISRRVPDKPGRGVVFLAPLKGPAQRRAAKKVSLATKRTLHSVRVEGPDRRGLRAKLTRSLTDAGINLRRLSGGAAWSISPLIAPPMRTRRSES